MENIKKFPDFQDETPEYAGETKPRIMLGRRIWPLAMFFWRHRAEKRANH